MRKEIPKIICLVDSENEGRNAMDFLFGFENVEMEVYYFYSKNSKTQAKKDSEKIIEKGILFHAISCNPGPKAMDFKLTAFLGNLTGKDPDSEYIILSNDHDFVPVIEGLKELGINVKRYGVNEETKELEADAHNSGSDIITENLHELNSRELVHHISQKTKAPKTKKEIEKEKVEKFLEIGNLKGFDPNVIVEIAENSNGNMGTFCVMAQSILPQEKRLEFISHTGRLRAAFLKEFQKETPIDEAGIIRMEAAKEYDDERLKKKQKKH